MDATDKTPISDKWIWLMMMAGSGLVAAATMESSLSYGYGYVLGFFALGLVPAGIVWAIKRQTWKWYHWLNTAAFIAVVLMLLNAFLAPVLLDYVQP